MQITTQMSPIFNKFPRAPIGPKKCGCKTRLFLDFEKSRHRIYNMFETSRPKNCGALVNIPTWGIDFQQIEVQNGIA